MRLVSRRYDVNAIAQGQGASVIAWWITLPLALPAWWITMEGQGVSVNVFTAEPGGSVTTSRRDIHISL